MKRAVGALYASDLFYNKSTAKNDICLALRLRRLM